MVSGTGKDIFLLDISMYVHVPEHRWSWSIPKLKIVSTTRDTSPSRRVGIRMYLFFGFLPSDVSYLCNLSRRPIRLWWLTPFPFGISVIIHLGRTLLRTIVHNHDQILTRMTCCVCHRNNGREHAVRSVRPRALVTVCLHVNTVHRYNWI